MSHPRYATAEIARRGRALYGQQFREKVEPSEKGKFLVRDIETGEYEIDADQIAAVRRAKAKRPEAALYLVRVGYPTAYRIGAKKLKT